MTDDGSMSTPLRALLDSNAVDGLAPFYDSLVEAVNASNEDDTVFDDLRSRSTTHTADALIADTARDLDAILITNDDRMTRAARRNAVEVLTTGQLAARLSLANG